MTETTDIRKCSRCSEREADSSILCALMLIDDYCGANIKNRTTKPKYDKIDLIKQCREWQKLAATEDQKELIASLIHHLENPDA